MSDGPRLGRMENVYLTSASGGRELVYPIAYQPLLDWAMDNDMNPSHVMSGSLEVDEEAGTATFHNIETEERQERTLRTPLPPPPAAGAGEGAD